jgi:RimJ/RimL family protein N-acetyltransferase
MPFLAGEDIYLRPVEDSDLDGPYSEWINSEEADRLTEHAQFPHSRRDLELYLESRNSSANHLWLGIVERQSGRHIGNIELSDIDWVHRKCRYAVIIGDESAQGKGYGLEASILLLHHAFGKLNLNRVELGVHEHNVAARKLYERLGFVEEGRQRQAFLREGAFVEIVTMGLLASDFKALHPSESTGAGNTK